VIPERCRKLMAANLSYESSMGGGTITAHTQEECGEKFQQPCRELMAANLSYESSMAGVTITAHTQKECGEEFQQACVDELLEAASSKLLEHEQGHFDITNVRAGQTQDALRALVEGFDREVTVCAKGDTDKAQKAGKHKAIAKAKKVLAKERKKLQMEYAKGHKGLAATQKQYDKQTKHGVVEAMQQTWQEQIGKGLP